jgi:hypothetical protein
MQKTKNIETTNVKAVKKAKPSKKTGKNQAQAKPSKNQAKTKRNP